ncbi:MAG: VPLPA-CTERM sorting domain-containing protein [Pseudomonadota bacterium]
MNRFLCLSALATFVALPATAATIDITDFSKAAYDGKLGEMSVAIVEDFETFSEGNVADGWSASSVGSFSTTGGVGSGGTVMASVANGNFAGNDGSELALRDGNVYGRKSTTQALTGDKADDMFLDSNDTYGIEWVVDIGSMFNRLMFTLMDATDVGAIMEISVGSETYSLSGLGDGDTKIVDITFDTAVSTATIFMHNTNGNGASKRNDGFSIDDIAVSAVPLPAGAWFLLGGLGALATLRRRKRAA